MSARRIPRSRKFRGMRRIMRGGIGKAPHQCWAGALLTSKRRAKFRLSSWDLNAPMYRTAK